MSVSTQAQDQKLTVQDMLDRMQVLWRLVIRKWWRVLIAAALGGGLALLFAFKQEVTYTAKLNFLVEEGSGGGGGLSALAGQFGFDLGGLGGGKGLLSSDNVMVYLKSRSLAKEVLMTAYDSAGQLSLADVFAKVTYSSKKWKKKFPAVGEISFPITGTTSRLQDSLLYEMAEKVNRKYLIIDKPDKKASFVEVTASMPDEILSKLYCERLVGIATKRYVEGKVTIQQTNVNRLQRRADSLSALLFKRTYTAAAAQENVLDINPALKSALVAPEVAGRDKLLLTTLYGEVVKNLEISKVALTQETPTIQIIDRPDLPLIENNPNKLLFLLVGAVVGGCLFIVLLLIKAIMKGALYR